MRPHLKKGTRTCHALRWPSLASYIETSTTSYSASANLKVQYTGYIVRQVDLFVIQTKAVLSMRAGLLTGRTDLSKEVSGLISDT
jgi:hypothetical protein